jgi:hypothetical protein
MAGTVESPGTVATASRRSIAVASGCATLVAVALLVAVILPAEYGVDPIGTGRTFGLLALSGAGAAQPVPPPQGAALAPTRDGDVALYPKGFNVDAREFVLGPYEYVEFKYHLEKDATMLFSWRADADVTQDFHGDREGEAGAEPQSYDKKPRRQADGSFVAPFTGIHGWFWENPGGESVTVRVTTAGFYAQAHEFHFDGTRRLRTVRGFETIPVTDK